MKSALVALAAHPDRNACMVDDHLSTAVPALDKGACAVYFLAFICTGEWITQCFLEVFW